MHPTPLRRLLVPALLLLCAPASPPGPSGTALDAALASVRADAIGADVHFLASDALEGRDTPSRGLRVAARYIRARMQRLGWLPGAGDGYFHTYALRHQAVDTGRSGLELSAGARRRSLRFGEDYLVTTVGSADAVAEGTVVTCGSAERSELAGLDLAGKWALCLDSDRHSSSTRTSLMRAGAVGMIVVPEPELGELRRIDRLRRHAAVALRGRVELPAGDERDRGAEDGADALLHQVYLTARGAAALGELVPGLDLGVPGRALELSATERRILTGDGGRIEVENVCALLPGTDPELRDEVILVSAHYDHDGVVNGTLYPGADDNASGTSGLLALAEALGRHGALRRSVMLIWVSGEEKGLFGSQAWVREPTLPEGARAICDINVDMIGRNEPGELYVTPSRRHREFNGLVRLALRFAPLEGFPELGNADRYYDRSDHAMFARLGIPVVFLFNGEHEDYHRPTDTPDKVDPDKIRRVVRLVLRIVDALQVDDPRL